MRTDDMTRSARALAAVGITVLVAACGSTLPPALVSGTGTSADGGLAAPTAAPGVTAGPGPSGPIAVPGGTLPGPGGPTTAPGAVTSAGPTTATVPPGAPAATKVTSPISLGLLYAVNDGAAPAGIDNGNTITPGKVMHALVDDWNHRGGIGGRHINPVYAEMHSYNNNYEQQIAAACAKFTDDNHVVAVLMTLQYYSDQLLSCLGKAHVLLLSGDFAAPDRQDAQRYPLYVTPLTQLGESRESSMVRHLAADGFLSSRSRVGVIVEDCAVDNRIYANGLVPALRSAKVPIASTFKTQCFQSLPDFGAQTSQMSSAVLQFRRQDVDRVMVLSAAAEANIVFAFSEVAENQGYRPGYALTSVAIPIALELNAPAAQMENMRGVGWLPVLDSSVRAQVPPTATGSACLRRLRAQGVPTQTSTDLWTAWSGCDTFFLYDALLRATSGNSDPATLLAALPDVGSSYVAASTVDGKLATSRNRLGPTTGRIFAFDAAKKFHYVSGSFDL